MDVAVEIPKYTVIQYVRHKGGKKKNVPYGVIVGVKMDEGFGVGYSLCNKKDRFNKKMALKIAIGRVYQGNCIGEGLNRSSSSATLHPEATRRSGPGTAIPNDVRRMAPGFIRRCNKYYFKDA